MFRQAVESGSALGRQVAGYMERGELVPNELTDALMQERLEQGDVGKGFVFDGYPRNLDQADVLDEALERQGASLDHVVKFMVTGSEIVERLAGRWVCPVCKTAYHLVSHPPKSPGICDVEGATLVQREDDREETILNRLEVYGGQTKPLYDRYAERRLLQEVDAIGSTDDVFDRLLKAIES